MSDIIINDNIDAPHPCEKCCYWQSCGPKFCEGFWANCYEEKEEVI